ncbi:Tir chaperone protein (CesT) family protein [Variovorax sp. OK605]|uniref:type III secretion system chaperone n=1 Tax=Variovorax sp. OK605 TaxID=1855317 RepID=UPI0008E5EFFE|nr:type III secretion system chaperone [Variovorax sp. OK605]SFQ73781.1 Tir chaperone protein (CesT) family protein [Variovorax sp. OK605]
MPVANYKDRLEDLGRHLNLASLAPNDAHVCQIHVGEAPRLFISYGETDDEIHWTSVVASLLGRDGVPIFRGLLSASLDWSLTRGFYFGLDEGCEVITLRHHAPASVLDTPRFIDITEKFLGVATFWTGRLHVEEGFTPSSAGRRLHTRSTESAPRMSDFLNHA